MAASRNRDTVKVEAIGVGEFDRFTSFQLTTDMTAPFEAAFETGDDGSWETLELLVRPGQLYRVWINDAPRMTGRVVLDSVPGDAQGVGVRFTVRSVLHEAAYASADPRISIQKATLRDILIAAYEPFGLTEADLVLRSDLARNLMTGARGQSGKPDTDLEPLKEDAAKVSPPETVYQFVDRHLRRFGLIHWDSPDGKIVVGEPTDTLSPLYRFRVLLGRQGRVNNVLSVERNRDWSEIPTQVGVFGTLGKPGVPSGKVNSIARDDDAIGAGFYRPVVIIADGVKTQEQARRAALRELSARRKMKDAWQVTVDGFSYRDGARRVPYAIDTCCDLYSNTVGGPTGTNYIPRVVMRRTAREGDTTALTLIAKGLWAI